MKNYERLTELPLMPMNEDFQLGLLRLGFHMLDHNNYRLAAKAFQNCGRKGVSCMPADYGHGQAMYRVRIL